MKSVLIVYASKTGTTQDVAAALAQKLPSAQAFDCCRKTGQDAHTQLNVSDYDILVLGTAMYIGAPMKAFKAFVAKHKDALANKPTVFFTCGVGTQEEDRQYLQKSLPEPLKAGPIIYWHMGGDVRAEKMSGFAKLAMREYEKKNGAAPGIDWNAVDALAQQITAMMGEKIS